MDLREMTCSFDRNDCPLGQELGVIMDLYAKKNIHGTKISERIKVNEYVYLKLVPHSSLMNDLDYIFHKQFVIRRQLESADVPA